jgi:hypothetical protein
MFLVPELDFCPKELILDVNLMHWLFVNRATILVLGISYMFSMICGFFIVCFDQNVYEYDNVVC